MRRLSLTPSGTRLSIFALFLAAAAAVLARFVWVGTHPASATSAASIPTVKPMAAPAAQPVAAVATSTPITRRTPVPTPKPAAVPAAEPVAVQYAGSVVSTNYGPIQVSVTVQSGKITAVNVSATPDSQRSQLLEAQALPTLKSETLQAQSANINTISGATTLSQAYIQSLQSALAKVGL